MDQSDPPSQGQYKVKDKAQAFFLHKDGNDTAVVMVHGFTGSPYDVRELGDFLHERGVDVFGVRIAGHGSHHEDLMHTTSNDWWQSVKDAADHATLSYKRVFLIGYSFGGNLVLNIAARDPQKYKGIVCLGTSVFINVPRTFVRFMNLLRILRLKKILRKPYVPRDQVAIFESNGNYAHIPLNSYMEFISFIDAYTKKELHKVTTPVLMIHSRGDRISLPKSSEYIFERLGSQYKELFILPEFNHNPLRSENKDKIFSKVLHFIEA